MSCRESLEAAMVIREVTGSPFKGLALHVVGLFAIVAGLVCFPFSTPLFSLLFAWIILFLVFACLVLLLTSGVNFSAYAGWAVAQYRRVIPGDVQGMSAKASHRLDAEYGTTGIWDRWLDGPGG
jgi:hypothetical protein